MLTETCGSTSSWSESNDFCSFDVPGRVAETISEMNQILNLYHLSKACLLKHYPKGERRDRLRHGERRSLAQLQGEWTTLWAVFALKPLDGLFYWALHSNCQNPNKVQFGDTVFQLRTTLLRKQWRNQLLKRSSNQSPLAGRGGDSMLFSRWTWKSPSM